MSTKYKRGNYSNLKLGDETTPNIKGEVLFSIYIFFFWVKLCVFNFKQCVKKPKKTIHKTMNFDSTNWLNKKKKKRSKIQ